MRKYLIGTALVAVMLAGASMANAGVSTNPQNKKAEEEAKLASQTRITKEQAQETALRRAPGTVESSELEREHGKLVYSFDIRNAKGTIDEVQVSAITGKVVRVEHENKKQEADEKRKEKREKN
ncbi:MAG: PepSY domain-containing protein [bacterium]